MFTKDNTPNYSPIDSKWPDDVIKNCCKSNPNGDCKCDDCCYDTWTDELKDITTSYNLAVETTDQLQKKVDFLTARRDRYKTWLIELDNLQVLARAVCDQLKLVAIQSDRIWYNSCEAVNAIEILYCMIIDILMQVDDLKTVCNNIDNCISNNNDPCLNKGQGILKYYADYKTKLDAVAALRDAIIKNIIDAVAIANLITNGISTKDCKCKDNPAYDPCSQTPTPCTQPTTPGLYYYGFKTIICQWYACFMCDTDCNKPPANQPNPCDCDFPTFDLPICNNSYRGSVQTWVDQDTQNVGCFTDQLNAWKTRREGLLACKNSLDAASKAVNPKDRCK
jgi:hypothetical protein